MAFVAPIKNRTYAQYTEWDNQNQRAPLRLGFTEVAKRDPLGPEIPKEAFKVTFYDQPDPANIQGHTATFEKENFSNTIYLGDTVIHPQDLKTHFQGAANLCDYYTELVQKNPDVQAIIQTRMGNYVAIKKDDEVVNSKGQKIWPLPVFPLGGI